MRISITKSELLTPLMAIAGVVDRRQSLPILANALVRCHGEKLTLTATDLEVEARMDGHLKTGSDGEFTMPARKVLDICRSLPDDAMLDIVVETGKINLRSGKSRFSLSTMPAADFPSVEGGEWQAEIAVDSQALRQLLEKTQFCIANQDVRYYLNGVLLHVEGDRLRAVGTDGHRMGVWEMILPEAAAERQAIVPRKGVQELIHMLGTAGGPVTLKFGANHIGLFGEGLALISKLIDGRYPDYKRVIPADQTIRIAVNREQVRAALARTAILANEKFHGVRLSLAPNVLKLTAHNPEQEEAVEEVPVEYKGATLEVGFNVHYLRDALAALEGDDAELGLKDADTGCLLRTPGNTTNQYVVMPMRL